MAWELVTEPDERERCCVVVDDVRCERPTAWRIAGEAWDDYTYVCADPAHLLFVSKDGGVAVPIGCTCPLPARGEVDSACPVHGLATLEVPTDLQAFVYEDGITVHAGSRDAADAMHAEILARRNRSRA